MNKLKPAIIQSILYLLIVTFVLFGVLFGFAGISSSAFKISFIPLTVLFISCILKRNYTKQKFMLLAGVLLLFIWALIVTLTYDGEGFPLHLFAFVGVLMLYYVSMHWIMPDTCLRTFLILGEVGAIFFAYLYREKGWLQVGMGITIGNFNPQHIGIWAFIFACVCLISFDVFKNKMIKVFSLAIIIYMWIIMVGSQTRTAWGTFVIVVILWLFPFTSIFKRKIIQWMIAAIPLIIIILTGIIRLFIGFSYTMKTFFNGREGIWYTSLMHSMDSPFWGVYNKYNTVYTHNIFVEHVLFYGYIIAIVFIVLTYKAINFHIDNINKQVSYDALVCFVGCLIVSSMEDLIFSAFCGGVFVFACSFLVLMSNVGEASVRQNVFFMILNLFTRTKKG